MNKTIADVCHECGGDIYVREEYYDFSGVNVCTDCRDTYVERHKKIAELKREMEETNER